MNYGVHMIQWDHAVLPAGFLADRRPTATQCVADALSLCVSWASCQFGEHCGCTGV